MLIVPFLSIINIKVPKKNARDTPSQKKLAIWIGFARRTKKTHRHALTQSLIGGRLQHHRHMWMAVLHGQFRDRRASKIVQVFFGMAHSSSPVPFQEEGAAR